MDGYSYSLYLVLALTVKTYMKALLKDESALDGHSYSLYRVLTLTAKACTNALLKDIYASEVTLIVYIGSSL